MPEQTTRTVPVRATVTVEAKRGRRRTPERLVLTRSVPVAVRCFCFDGERVETLGPFEVDGIPTAFVVADGVLHVPTIVDRPRTPVRPSVVDAVRALGYDPDGVDVPPHETPEPGWRYDHDEAASLLRLQAMDVAEDIVFVDGRPLARIPPPRVTTDRTPGTGWGDGRLTLTATYATSVHEPVVDQDLNGRERIREILEGDGRTTVEDRIGPAVVHPALSRVPNPARVVAKAVEALDRVHSRLMDLPRPVVEAWVDLRDRVMPFYDERTGACPEGFDPVEAFEPVRPLIDALEAADVPHRNAKAVDDLRGCLSVVARHEQIRALREAPPILDGLEWSGDDPAPSPGPGAGP